MSIVKLRPLSLLGTSLVIAIASCAPVVQSAPEPVRKGQGHEVQIDPMLLVSVAEYRRILSAIGDSIHPELRNARVPLLLYRPGVQDVLVGFPRRPPSGFRAVQASLLGGEQVYIRNDSTFFTLDDQNTTTTIDSVVTLVVADQYSRLRNQIRGTMLERPASVSNRWLDAWNFVPSVYDELQILLHESFHVIQARLAPGKAANEGAIARYPLLDPTNNALLLIEAHALRDALLAHSRETMRDKAAQFVAVRRERRIKLDSVMTEWENLNEFTEGTGRYVEYKFLKTAQRLTPDPTLYLRSGFTGYGPKLDTLLKNRINDLIAITSGTDGRFGNEFGGGPARFRLYELGAAQSLLLDALMPKWKERMFAPKVYLSDLIEEALSLTPDQRGNALARAKSAYRYDSIFRGKQEFETRGRSAIRARVDSITGGGQSTITIAYRAAGDALSMAYTPFGVTAVTNRITIYDLIPIDLQFKNGVELKMKRVVPIMLDRDARTITFSVDARPEQIKQLADGSIESDQFSIRGLPPGSIVQSGRRISITLR